MRRIHRGAGRMVRSWALYAALLITVAVALALFGYSLSGPTVTATPAGSSTTSAPAVPPVSPSASTPRTGASASNGGTRPADTAVPASGSGRFTAASDGG